MGDHREADLEKSRRRAAWRLDPWRDQNGAKEHAQIRQAVKDLGSKLVLGEPKTGKRDLELFDALAWQFERVYRAQGSPPLEQIVIPNAHGGLLNWNNFREHHWYPELRQIYRTRSSTATSRSAHLDTTTLKLSEQSSTGKQFTVTIRNGHIAQQNLKPYGFVF